MEFAHYKCPIIIIIISHIQASTYINKKKVLPSRVDRDIDLIFFFFFFSKRTITSFETLFNRFSKE